jgi:NAD(P)H-hydrate epimerase
VDREVVERIKSELGSFIWIPRDELGDYVAKSDAILIGPGMMRNSKERDGTVCDDLGRETRDLTLSLFEKFPQKRWVVDGGALQVVEAVNIPSGSVITPNKKEYRMLFGEDLSGSLEEKINQLEGQAKQSGLIILAKDVVSIASDGNRSVIIEGGNAGLIKGGTGDVLAGLAVGLLAKNEPLLAISVAQYLVKRAAERLSDRVGLMYNADDLAEEVTKVYGEEVR